MNRLLVVLFAIASVQSETTNVQQCTINDGELPINAYIEGCIDPPCNLPQLEDCIIHIIFRAPRMIRSMRTLATASVFPLPRPIEYPLDAREVTCNFLTNTFCPVLEDEVVQYTLRMYIEPLFFVGVRANIEFRIVDQDNQPVMCIRTGIAIVAPRGRSSENNTILIEPSQA